MLEQRQREMRVRNVLGGRVVREHYLREAVPCHSALCTRCTRAGKVLGADLTHFLTPDCTVALHYLEVLELPQLNGLLFTHTAYQHVQHKSRRLYQRLRRLLNSPRSDCVLFANEFQLGAYVDRRPSETHAAWQTRSVYHAAVWYHKHLSKRIPVVMVTVDPAVVEKYGSATEGVYVVPFQVYLESFWPDVPEASEFLGSLHQALITKEVESCRGRKREFAEHLPVDVLEAGIRAGRYIKGTVSMNKHKAHVEAFVQQHRLLSKDTATLDDVLVLGMKNRNRAIHGDAVAVELLARTEWQGRSLTLGDVGRYDCPQEESHGEPMPTGRVVGILQRNWRDYVAILPPPEEGPTQGRQAQRLLAVPWDFRIPKIRIATTQAAMLQDVRIVVRIDSWDSTSQYPNGHFVRALGKAGDIETEVAAILIERGISVLPFSEAQLREMPTDSPTSPWAVDPKEVAQRRDLRLSHLIFSIDPQGCEDVDDALSIVQCDGLDSTIEMGVHIADVTKFVPPGGPTDLEARSRATTYYFADRRFDMLPSVLSSNLCSLRSGEDRYAFSVLWRLDKETYEVKDVWFGRTVIRSTYKLSYETAQAVLDGGHIEFATEIPELCGTEDEQQVRLGELRDVLNILTDVARAWLCRRTANGGLQLEGSEVRVEFGGVPGTVSGITPKKALEVHETVAECMIGANTWVAQRLFKSLLGCTLLRRHPPPRPELFGPLCNAGESQGFHIDISSNKALSDSLEKTKDHREPLVSHILRILATHAMSNALYCSSASVPQHELTHYGLALPMYTHFTSPIRRYSDILVHRQLLAVLAAENGDFEDSEVMPSGTYLEEICQHLNERTRAAQKAQKDSVDLFQCLFFRDVNPRMEESSTDHRVADALVFAIRANGVLVYMPRFALRGAIFLKDKEGRVASLMADGTCDFRHGCLIHKKHEIVSQPSDGLPFVLRLFDHVTVHISAEQHRAHADTLHVHLLRLEGLNQQGAHPQDTPSRPRDHMVREVQRRAMVDVEQGRSSTVGPPACPLGRESYRQSTGGLYEFLEEFEEIALMEIGKKPLACVIVKEADQPTSQSMESE
uniref:DIS3-like exonuclease 1 isoform X2 n=1 Tax=Myxine glutinosa TaxID=7769 RepID=UPI00358FEBF1